jgi:hypothetical protein
MPRVASKNQRKCAREKYPGLQPKNCVSVLEKYALWQPKDCFCVQAMCRWSHSKIASVSLRNLEGGIQKLRYCKREVSWVAARKLRQCAGEVSRVSTKNRVRVLEKCPGWQQKMASVCRRRVEGGTQKSVSALEKCPGRQKNGVSVQENYRGWTPKIVFVCSRSVQVGSQKICVCAGELSTVSPKNFCQFPRVLSRLPAKKFCPCAEEFSKAAQKRSLVSSRIQDNSKK